jgi:hypothetical protein
MFRWLQNSVLRTNTAEAWSEFESPEPGTGGDERQQSRSAEHPLPTQAGKIGAWGCGIITELAILGCTDVAKYTEEDSHAALLGS